jgi:hypothetical protein
MCDVSLLELRREQDGFPKIEQRVYEGSPPRNPVPERTPKCLNILDRMSTERTGVCEQEFERSRWQDVPGLFELPTVDVTGDLFASRGSHAEGVDRHAVPSQCIQLTANERVRRCRVLAYKAPNSHGINSDPGEDRLFATQAGPPIERPKLIAHVRLAYRIGGVRTRIALWDSDPNAW